LLKGVAADAAAAGDDSIAAIAGGAAGDAAGDAAAASAPRKSQKKSRDTVNQDMVNRVSELATTFVTFESAPAHDSYKTHDDPDKAEKARNRARMARKNKLGEIVESNRVALVNCGASLLSSLVSCLLTTAWLTL
jgi:cell pole-organizing protein PopZ